MIAQATAFAPNYNQAINAAVRLFQLIDRKPKIDSTGAAGLKLVRSRREAKIIFLGCVMPWVHETL